MSAPIEWTWWSSPKEPHGMRGEADSFETLVVMLSQSARQPHDGRAWAPVTFEGDRRAAANVERVFAVGMDVDVDGQPERVADALRGLAAFVHTTRSHSASSPRCRAIVPLASPTDAAGHGRAWRALAARLARAGVEVDQATKDASRLWFLPSRPVSGEPTLLVLEGAPLPVPVPELDVAPAVAPMAPAMARVFRSYAEGERVVKRAARWLECAEPSVAGQHGHCRAFVVARMLVDSREGFGLSEAVAFALMVEWNKRCAPLWSHADLRRKVQQASRARTAPRGTRKLELVGGGR